MNAIANQNKRLTPLTNKDDHQDNYKEIFEELVKEKFDEIKELTYEIKNDDLIYYFTSNTARKRFYDFNNGIECFRKIQYGELKLEEANKLQNVFKSNLNEISKGRFKSDKQKSALENIKLLHKSQEAFIKLFNDYSSIAPKAKYKTIHGKGILSMSAHVARSKVSDNSNLKILSSKQMLQRLTIAFAQVKTGNKSEKLVNEIRQIIYSFYRAKEIA